MQHAHVTAPNGARPIAIDVDGEPQGILVAAPGGFRFLAVRFDAFAIDGHTFATLEAAQLAARRALRSDGPDADQ